MQAMSHRLYSTAARCPTYRFALRAAALGARPHVEASRLIARASSSGSMGLRPSWDIRMLYDGDCPLCMREVGFLRARDAGKDKIDFVDIASPEYDPAQNQGISYEQAMERIHAITADGQVIRDVEVFRRLYEAVGLGWVYAITKFEPIGALADGLYAVWAKYRMEVTGRDALDIVLEKRRTQGKMCGAAETDACTVPAQSGAVAGQQKQ